MSLIFNVFPNYVCRNPTSNTADKIAIVPQLSCPKLLSQFGKLSRVDSHTDNNPASITSKLGILLHPCKTKALLVSKSKSCLAGQRHALIL